jgi:peptidoglycan/LPS O-acetylase OafA/YrhL
MTQPRIASYCRGRDNNFTLARFVAASLVIFTHSFGVTGHGNAEPMRALFGVSAGTWAVHVFFVMSGFLVAKSYDTRGSLLAFMYGRFMRIYPGMWACVVVCAFLIGPIFTSFTTAQYLSDVLTIKFVLANCTLLPWGVVVDLPGVFDQHRLTAVNLSLWTLPYELWMYIALGLLGVTRLLHRPIVAPALLATTALLYFGFFWSGTETAVANYTRLGFYFASGAFLYLWRERILLSGRVASIALAAVLLTLAVPYQEVRGMALEMATPYLVTYFALVPGGKLRLFNRMGDYSYGVYVYGFPMQQIVLALLGTRSPWVNGLFAMIGVLLFAVPSWHFIEKPALDHRAPAWMGRLVAPGRRSWRRSPRRGARAEGAERQV